MTKTAHRFWLVGIVVLTATIAYVTISLTTLETRKWVAQAEKYGIPTDTWVELRRMEKKAAAEKTLSDEDIVRLTEFLDSDKIQMQTFSLRALELGLRDSRPEVLIAYCNPLLQDERPYVRTIAMQMLFRVAPEEWPRVRATVAEDQSVLVQSYIETIDQTVAVQGGGQESKP